MVKIFVTGDNHFGKKYNRYPEIRHRLTESRYGCLEQMVRQAEEEGCELFAVTGDLFDSCVSVDRESVARAARILAGFAGTVLVLPGNHDYYTGEEKVWKRFEEALAGMEHNVVLLKEFRPYRIVCAEETVTVYPALCQSKHGTANNLDWIRKEGIRQDGTISVGMAHGAIQGVTPDMNQSYFLMTEEELNRIPADLWLIGHTHVPYPADLREDEDTFGRRIFNAGTHEQLDLSNHTEGTCMILTCFRKEGKTLVGARRYVSGRIRYLDWQAQIRPGSGEGLKQTLERLADQAPVPREDAVIRVTVSGAAQPEEYEARQQIYEAVFGGFLFWEIRDAGLQEVISSDRIRREYAQTSFAARFLEALAEDPAQLQMAYQLLRQCREEEQEEKP